MLSKFISLYLLWQSKRPHVNCDFHLFPRLPINTLIINYHLSPLCSSLGEILNCTDSSMPHTNLQPLLPLLSIIFKQYIQKWAKNLKQCSTIKDLGKWLQKDWDLGANLWSLLLITAVNCPFIPLLLLQSYPHDWACITSSLAQQCAPHDSIQCCLSPTGWNLLPSAHTTQFTSSHPHMPWV